MAVINPLLGASIDAPRGGFSHRYFPQPALPPLIISEDHFGKMKVIAAAHRQQDLPLHTEGDFWHKRATCLRVGRKRLAAFRSQTCRRSPSVRQSQFEKAPGRRSVAFRCFWRRPTQHFKIR